MARLLIGNRRLPITDCQLGQTNFRLLIADCHLFMITDCGKQPDVFRLPLVPLLLLRPTVYKLEIFGGIFFILHRKFLNFLT
jgi:hypothetical protein